MAKNDKKSKKVEMKLLNRAAKKLIKQRRDRGQRGREHGSSEHKVKWRRVFPIFNVKGSRSSVGWLWSGDEF